MTRRRKIIIGIAGFIILCCIGTIVSSIFFPNEDDTAETTPIVQVAEEDAELPSAPDEPTNTAAPTDIPATNTSTPAPPTNTPVPATNTPTPTETAVPATNTPDPGQLTDEEETYRDSIVEISAIYINTLSQLGEQLTAAGNDITLMIDDDWKLEVATSLALLLFAGEEARSLDPPERFEDLHEHWLNAAAHYDLVAEYLADGIDEFDIDKINSANEQMGAGEEDILLAIEEIDRLTAQGIDFTSP